MDLRTVGNGMKINCQILLYQNAQILSSARSFCMQSALIVGSIIAVSLFSDDCAGQAILDRNSLGGQKAGPNQNLSGGPGRTGASAGQTNSGAGNFQSNTSPAAFANPTPPAAGTPTDPSLPRVARLLNPPSSLPNQAGQVWRTYDLSPYTRRITSVKNPEQAVVDWVIRETGTDIWFRGPTGVLTAASDRMHVYHTPEVHRKVAGIIDRLVQSQGKNVTLGIRLFTVGKPDWRAAAFPLLQSFEVRTPGVEGWIISKENAAILANQLARRSDYKALEIGNLVLPEGQKHTFKKRQVRPYVRSQKFRLQNPNFPAGGGLYEPVTSRFEEGYTLDVSPLGLVGSNTMEIMLKCQIDQLEKFHTVNIPVPLVNGQTQNLSTFVPQVVSWRLHESFQWPKDQVLLLSCGVVATTGNQKQNNFLQELMGNQKGRGEAILLVEFKGDGSKIPNRTPATNRLNLQGRSAAIPNNGNWQAAGGGRVAIRPGQNNSNAGGVTNPGNSGGTQLRPIRRQ